MPPSHFLYCLNDNIMDILWEQAHEDFLCILLALFKFMDAVFNLIYILLNNPPNLFTSLIAETHGEVVM